MPLIKTMLLGKQTFGRTVLLYLLISDEVLRFKSLGRSEPFHFCWKFDVFSLDMYKQTICTCLDSLTLLDHVRIDLKLEGRWILMC